MINAALLPSLKFTFTSTSQSPISAILTDLIFYEPEHREKYFTDIIIHYNLRGELKIMLQFLNYDIFSWEILVVM